MRLHVLLAITVSVLVGCGKPRAPTSPTVSSLPPTQIVISAPSRDLPPPDGVAPPRAGAYTLRIDVDERCPFPSVAKVRTYDVLMTESRTTYLSVVTIDGSLFGDIWFASWGGVIFRWNGTEDGFDACGSSETIGSRPFCVWGEGPWSAASDGTISGLINGGAYFAEQRCDNQSHRFVLRPKT